MHPAVSIVIGYSNDAGGISTIYIFHKEIREQWLKYCFMHILFKLSSSAATHSLKPQCSYIATQLVNIEHQFAFKSRG